MNWLSPIYGLVRRPYRRITAIQRDAITPQHRWFSYLVRRGASTAYGKAVGISSDMSYERFRESVPIQPYETLYPWIERHLRGEKDVLWPGQVRWFARSSGTTNDRSKFIPVTSESLHLNHFRASKELFATYLTLYRDSTHLLEGKIISIGGSHQVSHLSKAARCGDLSAVLLSNMPAFYRLFRAPALDIALIPSWEEKLPRMVKALLSERNSIVGLAGVPTWTILLFEELLRQTGFSHVLEVFPRFEAVFHGAVSFTPYEKLFARYLPSPQVHYMEIYNASEGFIAFQDTTDSSDMLLMADHGIFYEFIPFSAWESGRWEAVPLSEIGVGETYAVVLTTVGGLWRYLIGDTVRFVSKQPPRLRIVGRTRHYINAFGEEVMIDQAESALLSACQATGAQVRDYTVAPIYMGSGQRGAHQWLVEFIQAPQDMELFIQTLDRKLRELNSDYDAKREADLALGPPEVFPLPPDTFYRWLKSKGRLGGQNKVPRLSTERTYADEILAMVDGASE
ncbi:MAG: GH3 auxin-responsive promoter family protein [Bacteroidia bacterium]|nr:GH3 auxin-responsive promoter family protein [Bacteroidia bacterium]